MNPAEIKCPGCGNAISREQWNVAEFSECPYCHKKFQARVYPAIDRRFSPGMAPENTLSAGEASCFYHPANRAVIPCGSCGRFLCALCDCELDAEHLCPKCLESGKTKGKLAQVQDERMLYGEMAFALALYPLILAWPFTIFTAPAAIWYGVRHWKSPGSLPKPRTKRYCAAAIILSLLQVGGWTAGGIIVAMS